MFRWNDKGGRLMKRGIVLLLAVLMVASMVFGALAVKPLNIGGGPGTECCPLHIGGGPE